MADALKDIIKRLEQQRSAIDKALNALREVDGNTAGGGGSAAAEPGSGGGPATAKRGRRKGGITAEGRRRLSESLRARWAAKRAGEPSEAATKKATGKRRGRKPRA